MLLRLRTRNYSTLLPNISHLLEYTKPGESVEISGWVKTLRKQKDITFFDLNNGSTCDRLQVVVASDKGIKLPTIGSSVSIKGQLNLSPKGKLELVADNIDIIGEGGIDKGYPFLARTRHPNEYIRQYLHLRSKTFKFPSLLRIRSAAMTSIHNYFQSRGFINVNTPIITSNDCEGAGETFKVIPDNRILMKEMMKEGYNNDSAFFNRKSFLTVSGQMHLEAAANGLGNVYTLGPTFRAENSKSRLHLSEFYMLEAELAFLDELEKLTDFTEEMLKCITRDIIVKTEAEFKNLDVDVKNIEWLDKKFLVLSYDEAVAVLRKNGAKYVDCKEGLNKENELFLVNHFGNVPLFVIKWPKELKPFYMRTCSQDNTKVAALDLLVPVVGELVGGSLRENDHDVLESKLPKTGDLQWYLDLRKYGGIPTGGFGLGFERYLQFLLNIDNIKDTIPFPRWPHNCAM